MKFVLLVLALVTSSVRPSEVEYVSLPHNAPTLAPRDCDCLSCKCEPCVCNIASKTTPVSVMLIPSGNCANGQCHAPPDKSAPKAQPQGTGSCGSCGQRGPVRSVIAAQPVRGLLRRLFRR